MNFTFKSVIMSSFLMMIMVISSAYSQTISDRTVSLDIKKAKFSEFVQVVEKQTGYSFKFDNKDVSQLSSITFKATNKKLIDVLTEVLDANRTGLTFTVQDKTISVFKDPNRKRECEIFGVVVESDGTPVAWANVQVVGTHYGTTTDENGEFRFKMPEVDGTVKVQASFIGMETKIMELRQNMRCQFVLDDSALELDQVVVTGIFEREKKNFTGSSKRYTEEDLKLVGNLNILSSLKTLDPNFAIIEDNTFGSDPNRLPDIEIRGKTSIIGLSQEFKTDPNQPLFILDGFESSLAVISDLSMDRVESITLLKDASATAIYGSKAANGVVVVETKRPKSGKLSINYNANMKFNFADLSAYNMMNSSEKLEYEKLAGEYGEMDINGTLLNETSASLYYQRLAEVKRGVDTYWMADPLRYGVSHSHNLFAEGGDDKMRYGIGINYSGTEGVMKGSGRDVLNGNIRLMYRWGKFSFTEYLNIDNTESSREMVPFSEYSRANPYYRKYNQDGEATKILESNAVIGGYTNIYNPLYNASLNNFDDTKGLAFRNNFEADWRPINEIKVRGRYSFTRGNQKQVTFYSPFNTRFEEIDRTKKGSYNERNTKTGNSDGDLSVTYGKLFDDKYMVNAVGGMRMSSMKAELSGYGVSGFTDDSKPNPSFSNGYTENTKPTYTITESRSVSYYFNAGFAAYNKYLADISLRSDGSSIFGVNNRFTNTWSLGLGWNISDETFMKNLGFIDYMKIRGSIGNPGNQNFDAGMVFNTYTYNPNYHNLFGLSSFISSYGNRNLKWQKTIDSNIGLDLEVLDHRLRLNFDTYKKVTDPLLIYISVPTSTGTNQVPYNVGTSVSTGYSFMANYSIIRKNGINWQVNTNGRYNKSVYKEIGKLLDSFNKDNLASRSLNRYYDNGSPTDLWAVKSAGIDPATGREIFIKKDGSQTFTFDYADEVIVGNSNPDIEGILGTSLYYKKFTFAFNVRYRFGGDTFLSALFDKVENISSSSIRYNQDKRALYDRWQKPGDQAKFKAISLTESTPMSSRFVTSENTIAGESISLGYETNDQKLHSLGVSSVNFRLYLNDIFRISTVKNERGIDYPFERSVSFTVGLRFL